MFKLWVKVGNAAFEDGDLVPELTRILQVAIQKLEEGNDKQAILLDINGNLVGGYTLTRR